MRLHATRHSVRLLPDHRCLVFLNQDSNKVSFEAGKPSFFTQFLQPALFTQRPLRLADSPAGQSLDENFVADLKIDTFRSSGAGGQHINKTSSAIRITHIPTGTVVECQDERSQYKNKDKALKVLKSRLLKEKQDAQANEIAADRKSQVGTGDRSERIRTYNYPQGRLTDHRIGLTLYKLEDILNGNLDEVIDALVTADRAEKLKESMEQG